MELSPLCMSLVVFLICGTTIGRCALPGSGRSVVLSAGIRRGTGGRVGGRSGRPVLRQSVGFQPVDALTQVIDGCTRRVRLLFDGFVERANMANVAPDRLNCGVEFGDVPFEGLDSLCQFAVRVGQYDVVGVAIGDRPLDGTKPLVDGIEIGHRGSGRPL